MLKKSDALWAQGRRVCIGLDSDYDLLPKQFSGKDIYSSVLDFNASIISATCKWALCYKLNLGAYLKHGYRGVRALEDTCFTLKGSYPEIPFIIDQKTGDIGNSNRWYAHFAYEVCGADAMTAHSYPGHDAAEVLMERPDTTVFFLCKTSNPRSDDFQDVMVVATDAPDRWMRLYELVAYTIEHGWQGSRGACGLVAGSTHASHIAAIRKVAPSLPILSPGIGKQQGDLEKTLQSGEAAEGRLLVNSSSGIIFASANEDYAAAAYNKAAELTDSINNVLGSLVDKKI